MVLKKAGFKRRKPRSGEAVAKAAPAKAARKPGMVTIEDVITAKRVAEQFGGADRLLAALKALDGCPEEADRVWGGRRFDLPPLGISAGRALQ